MKSVYKYLRAYLPSAVWAGLIFVLSSQSVLPSFDASLSDFLFKKLAHISVYAVLYFLLFWGTQQVISASNHRSQLIIPLLLAFTYAVADELHQSFVPGRYPTLRDIGYDSLGIATIFLKIYHYI